MCAIIPPSTAKKRDTTKNLKQTHTDMTDTQKDQLIKAIADLIRNSSEGDRIWDKSFAVFFNIETGNIRCDHDLHIHEDERDILRADHVINYVGREEETEAWAAANPAEAADQYVQQFYWDLDEVMDRVASDND